MSRHWLRKMSLEAWILASCFGANVAVHADAVGIMGGNLDISGTSPYVVLITDLEGSILTVTGLPMGGVSPIYIFWTRP